MSDFTLTENDISFDLSEEVIKFDFTQNDIDFDLGVGPRGDKGSDGSPGIQGPEGPQGIAGTNGTDGEDGSPGVGVPTGGSLGQVLAKKTNTDYDTEWIENVIPVGSNQEIQYNDNNSLGASPNFKFDKTTNTVNIGQAAQILPDNPLAIAANVDSYLQVNMKNSNTGVDASSDYVLTADDGDDSHKYFDFGICNSGYDSELWDVAGAYDGYVFSQDGNIAIGCLTPEKEIKFFIGQTDGEAHPEDVIATINENGIDIATGKTFSINGTPIGATTFTSLTDAPSSYTSQGTKLVRVKSDETGLEFFTQTGGGDVTGAASSTDNAVVRFDSTTGKVIQNSAVTIGDTGLIIVNNSVPATASAYETYGLRIAQGASNLTLGGDADYEYIQSWGGKKLWLNSQGNTVIIGNTSAHKIGLQGTTVPTYELSFASNANTIGNERSTVGTGQNIILRAGGALSGGTDLSGGTVYVTGGNSTGTGNSAFIVSLPQTAKVSGTTDNSYVSVVSINGKGWQTHVASAYDTAVGSYAIFSYGTTIDPTANSSSEFRAIAFENYSVQANSYTLNTVIGGRFTGLRPRSAAVVSTVYGLDVYGSVVDSGSAADVYVTSTLGARFTPVGKGSGTSIIHSTDAIGVSIGGIPSSLLISTNYYGVKINSLSGTGNTITNNYGLYVNSQTSGGTLNYGIYTNLGLNHFGDKVEIQGTTADGSTSVIDLLDSGAVSRCKVDTYGRITINTPDTPLSCITISRNGGYLFKIDNASGNVYGNVFTAGSTSVLKIYQSAGTDSATWGSKTYAVGDVAIKNKLYCLSAVEIDGAISASNLSGTNTGDQTIPDQLSDLTDDTTHRLVTDTEKNIWNGKQDALGFTAENSSNKETSALDTNTTKYPCNNVVKTAIDLKLNATSFVGLAKITVGTSTPATPSTGDLWIDTN